MNQFMKQNVGSNDRIVRLVLGALLVAVGIVGYIGLVDLAVLGLSALAVGVVAVLVGLWLLGTGWMRTSPLYGVLGVDTVSDEATTDGVEEAPGTEAPKTN